MLKVDPHFAAAQVHLSDVVFFKTLTRALTKALESPEPWQRAWQGGEPVEVTLSVDSSDGKQEVVLGSELSQGFGLFSGDDSELLAAFDEMDGRKTSKRIDFDQLEHLERSLVSRVVDCPEALELEEPTLGLGMLLDLANQLLIPVTQLDAIDLKKMLFEDIPRTVMRGGDSAQNIVSSLQFAYQWMMKRHSMEHGADCLAVLDKNAVENLENRLVDAQLFGLRKARMISDIRACEIITCRFWLFLRLTGKA